MKTLLIFPPQWTPFSPPLGLPALTAYLRQHGHETDQKDANAEFYDYILSKDFINKVKHKVDTFKERCNSILGDSGNIYTLPEKTQVKYKVIEDIFNDLGPWWPELETNTERAKKILRDPEMFYQPLLLTEAIFHLRYSLQAIGLAYFPSDILLNYYSNINYKLSVDSIKEAVDDEGNIFADFYDNRFIEKVIASNPDIIGISIACNTQILSGLTLAKKIRKVLPNAHINIGGNAFTRLLDVIEKRPELFGDFFDSITYGEGECSLSSLIDELKSDKDLSKVPSLVYKHSNKIITTPAKTPYNLNDLPTPDYTGLDLSLYLNANTILPVQSSRGCYWQKCSFCDHDYGNKFAIKTPSKMVKELKEISEKYNVKHFYFVDEAISPNYMKSLAEKIIENKLDISWYTCARAEAGFSEEISKLAAKSGLKMILWGLESGNERILKLINKGIKKEEALQTLKNTHNANIWNHAFLFFGFPSENLIEAMDTVNMLIENKDIISSFGMGPFTLGKYSPIAKEPEKYLIESISDHGEELTTATEHFTTSEGLTRTEVNNFVLYNTEYCSEQYGYPLWMSLGGFKDHIFLYIDKYGIKVPSYTPDETVQMFGSF